MTGSDILDFLATLLDDIRHIGDADIISIVLRIFVVVVVLVFTVSITRFISRMLWDMFGGIIKWIYWQITAPKRAVKRWGNAIESSRWKKKQEKENQIRQEQWEKQEAIRKAEEEKKRIEEQETALKILNTPPDLSRFKK